MSIHSIPDRFLNTTLDIYKEVVEPDDVGDSLTAKMYVYSTVKANVQSDNDMTEFEYQGSVHVRDHIAYINRMDASVLREIKIGWTVVDLETNITYLILGVEEWQSANVNISDSHHIKLILKSISGIPPTRDVGAMVTSKGHIDEVGD